MSAQDAFRVLDLPEGATPDEIKNAYRVMALKYHPDRHINSHSREVATRYFLEVTEAYRTLVREGHVKNRNTPMANRRPEPPPPPPMRAPPMAHKNSSESSISLDSFVHMVASSSESLTTPASSKKSIRSTWKQGVRKPAEAASSKYRNPPNQAHIHGYDTPPRGGAKGLAPSFLSDVTIPIPSNNHSRNSSNSQNKQNGYQSGTSFPSSSNRTPPTIANPPHQPHDPNRRNSFPPYAIPLLSLGLGPSGEWTYSLSLTLEELFIGKHFRFGITRTYLSNKTKNVVIEIDIPAGCRSGTRILCRNVGHEWQSGEFQDIAFVIEEVPHDRFVRVVDDLVMDVRLPWVDSLRRQGGKVPFVGIDGRAMCIRIDYPQDKNMKGRSVLKGAGMPVRERGQVVGRGSMVVQWEILPPKAKILHFLRRLWGRK